MLPPNCTCFEASTSKKKCPACGDHNAKAAGLEDDKIVQGRTILRLYPEKFVVTETYPTYVRVNPKKHIPGTPIPL